MIVDIDGEEALEKARVHGSDIHMLLFDLELPKLSGLRVYDELNKLMPGLKVIFMSGYTDEGAYGNGKCFGGHEFLSKPVSPDGLLNLKSLSVRVVATCSARSRDECDKQFLAFLDTL